MVQDHWKTVAREMVAALRGSRTRAQLSRRLGYRTNTVSDWEAGRRFPTAAEFLNTCEQLRVDVDAAFERFHPATACHLRRNDEIRLQAWLGALCGNTSIRLVAERSGLSRFAVSRWLKGQTRPRLHELLRLVEAMTYRASDLADALVGIDKLPTLIEQHRRRSAARRLAFECPDSEAILRVMETTGYRALSAHRTGALAAVVGVEPQVEHDTLQALEAAGILELVNGRYLHRQALTVDTSAEPKALNRLKAHWAAVALKRIEAPREQDWLGYNLMSLSEGDLERAREILRDAYRQIRALAASSEPVEVAALLNLQLVTFPQVTVDP